MYWNEQNSTPSNSSGSSEGCFTPPAPAFDLLPSRFDNKSWPMQSTSTQEMLQSVLKARKTRKTISGGEAVWPLDLEAALLEGKLFSLYVPDRSLTPCFYRAGAIST
jgi:transcriptional enhancer factor